MFSVPGLSERMKQHGSTTTFLLTTAVLLMQALPPRSKIRTGAICIFRDPKIGNLRPSSGQQLAPGHLWADKENRGESLAVARSGTGVLQVSMTHLDLNNHFSKTRLGNRYASEF